LFEYIESFVYNREKPVKEENRMPAALEKIRSRLHLLYGGKTGDATLEKLNTLLRRYKSRIKKRRFSFSEKDVVLITYGDAFQSPGERPLSTLNRFLQAYGQGIVTIVHILPFFPYSSDDGFSVINYKKVDPALGTWENIAEIGKGFLLMFDAVINHISSQSREFQRFIAGDAEYRDFFITVEPGTDLSSVFRPRALPLLTEFETAQGEKLLWTTFSFDQIDLNFKNPDVLLFIIELLLTYAAHGASIIRLDAIAYLWKEIGTSCIHLPQTHEVVKLFRNVFEYAAPHMKIITETNVPHEENISYFGNGSDEAHLVYNFALPPLTVHTLHTGDASILSSWVSALSTPGQNTFFYNFTASHDGIGVLPAGGILSTEQIDDLVRKTKAHGGRVGYRSTEDGSQSAYELNISLFDLISDPESNEPVSQKVDRFVASQAIALSIAGVPALYYHSLVGSRNFYEGVEKTGMNRAINREKLDLDAVSREINTEGTIRNLVMKKLTALIEKRRTLRAFHPQGKQHVLSFDPAVFGVERVSPDGDEHLLVLINVSGHPVSLKLEHRCTEDTLSGRHVSGMATISPYEILWLQRAPRS
jgi:glycosidase